MVLASRVFSTASSRSKQSLDNKSHLQNNQKHASAFAPGVLLFFKMCLKDTIILGLNQRRMKRVKLKLEEFMQMYFP